MIFLVICILDLLLAKNQICIYEFSKVSVYCITKNCSRSHPRQDLIYMEIIVVRAFFCPNGKSMGLFFLNITIEQMYHNLCFTVSVAVLHDFTSSDSFWIYFFLLSKGVSLNYIYISFHFQKGTTSIWPSQVPWPPTFPTCPKERKLFFACVLFPLIIIPFSPPLLHTIFSLIQLLYVS